jgi:hypothetical protein
MDVSTRALLSARSSLLPARTRVRFGEARARASLRKGCSELKDAWDVMS